MFDVTQLLEELKATPFEELRVTAPHTGLLTFADLQIGSPVIGPSGMWKEIPGTLLFTLDRERNDKPQHADNKGTVSQMFTEHEGQFVEAGTPILTIRHFLSKQEVLNILLKRALHPFAAPERAKYYFTPDVDRKIRASGCRSIVVSEGSELFIMSRMKREVPLNYSGPAGIIYATYIKANESVDAGAPLIGICPQERLALIDEAVNRVQSEWEEQE